jgi:hypothetical protein
VIYFLGTLLALFGAFILISIHLREGRALILSIVVTGALTWGFVWELNNQPDHIDPGVYQCERVDK